MPHRIVNVTEFKAKCLAYLAEVGDNGSTITITKRGRPLAIVAAPQKPAWKSPEGAWAGKVTFADWVLEADTSRLWEVARR
jgi:prevent-host-death family protein